MANLELFVNGTNDTIGKLNLYGDEPISLNMSIQDVKDISKRNSTYSQTFTIPADKNNNIILNHIFNIGSDSSFDPGKKTPCWLSNDTVPLFIGNFQLTKINVKNANVISYECVVYGEVIDLVKTLGDKLLTDLDFSELNHTYDADNIEASWYADTKTLGYYYPLIDYGYDLSLSEINSGILNVVVDNGEVTSSSINTLSDINQSWGINQYAVGTSFSVTITAGEGIGQTRNILLNNTTTLTTYTNWDIIPDLSSKYQITKLDTTNPNNSNGTGLSPLIFKPAISNTYLITKLLNENGFALSNGIINRDIIAETISPFNGDFNNTLDKQYINSKTFKAGVTSDYINTTFENYFDNITTNTYFDNTGNYDTINGAYMADAVYDQNFVTNIRYSCPQFGSNTSGVATIQYYRSSIVGFISTNSDAVICDGNIRNISFTSPNFNDHTSTLYYPLQPGETIWVKIFITGFGPGVFATIYANGTYWYNRLSTKLIKGGDLLFNNFIPKNIKQVDYLKSIITMFNLMVIPNKDNSNQLSFITRDEYYASGIVKDWTNKVDHNDKIEEILLSEQQTKTIKFNYKEDKDYYNANYKDKTNSIYGEHIYNLDNEWIEGEKKIDVIFSPTPVDKVLGTRDMYVPKIAKREEKSGIYGRTDFNIRFLRKNKTLMPTVETFQLEGKSAMSFYPYAGHLDNPTSPQIDYNFGNIKFAYYPELTTLTPNNLVNTYWRNQLDDINDKNSKLIRLKIYLTPDDISRFNFNDNIFIDGLTDDGGHYFYVNKITYIPTTNLPSIVELIKVNRKESPILTDYVYSSNPISIDPIKVLDLGQNNATLSAGTILTGNNNSVGYNSNGAFIIGNNNIIANNASNVVVINHNNLTITESFVTVVGNLYINPDGTFFTLYDDIDSGKDEVLNPFATNLYNNIDSGLNAVLNLGSTSPVKDINSGLD